MWARSCARRRPLLSSLRRVDIARAPTPSARRSCPTLARGCLRGSVAASAESADEASEADGERLPGVSFRTLAEVSEGEGEEGETADPPLRQLEFDSRQSVSVVRSVLYVKIKSFSFRLLA